MQRPFRTALSLAMICGLLIFGAVPAAYAVPVLSLSDGIHPTVTITDEGLGDLASDPGAILFYGSLGNFGINITAGTTKPAIGSADEPILDISSLNIASFGAGTLTITFSETGFTGQVPAFTGSVGGTTTGTGTTSPATSVSRCSRRAGSRSCSWRRSSRTGRSSTPLVRSSASPR